jgi:hypothetical protein
MIPCAMVEIHVRGWAQCLSKISSPRADTSKPGWSCCVIFLFEEWIRTVDPWWLVTNRNRRYSLLEHGRLLHWSSAVETPRSTCPPPPLALLPLTPFCFSPLAMGMGYNIIYVSIFAVSTVI